MDDISRAVSVMDVSIIVPVYNVAPYIEACLISIMRQKYKGRMECLIVDDCGSDGSMVIVQRVLANYVGPIQFRIISHKYNRGISAARNTGTKEAIGEYIFYIDSDDEITPDCIDKMMRKVAEYPDVEMVQGNTRKHLVDNDDSEVMVKVVTPYAETNEIVRDCFYQKKQLIAWVWNKLLRRDFIIANGIEFMEGLLYEDNLWTFYLVKNLKSAAFLEDVTYEYRIRPQSITTGLGEVVRIKSYIVIYNDIFTHLTPGFERMEFDFCARRIAGCYYDYNYARIVPEFKDVLQLYWRNRRYGSLKCRVFLDIIYFLSHFRFGWVIWGLLRRMTRPHLLVSDVKHLLGKQQDNSK